VTPEPAVDADVAPALPELVRPPENVAINTPTRESRTIGANHRSGERCEAGARGARAPERRFESERVTVGSVTVTAGSFAVPAGSVRVGESSVVTVGAELCVTSGAGSSTTASSSAALRSGAFCALVGFEAMPRCGSRTSASDELVSAGCPTAASPGSGRKRTVAGCAGGCDGSLSVEKPAAGRVDGALVDDASISGIASGWSASDCKSLSSLRPAALPVATLRSGRVTARPSAAASAARPRSPADR
jgi:hypothetical protein